MEKPTWSEVFKDKSLIVSVLVMSMFFVLILVFSIKPSQLNEQDKMIILQTFAVVFSISVGFWLKTALDNKKKPDAKEPPD